jgi:uncharacterized protein (DUF924 family)
LNQDKPWTDLIDYWFGESLHDPAAIPQRMSWWFSTNAERDSALNEKFGGLVEECAAGDHYQWLGNPEGRLALILALDQLPRNCFRGTPQAFAHDPYTAALCLAAAHTGQDRVLQPIQRVFLYMPLQHFEDLQAQEAGVTLYERLAEETPVPALYREGVLPFARQHRDIIARFGRFPHRNKVLNRQNTPEEAEYLAGDVPTFGQS